MLSGDFCLYCHVIKNNMKLTMCKTVCNDCPFSKDSLRGWLGPHTLEEILDTQQYEGLFSCHMRRKDESSEEEIRNGSLPICRGFIASASASCKLFGQTPTTGPELKRLQDMLTPNDKENILSRWEFKNHHTI